MIEKKYVLVKHGESDFRLHRRDGTETGHRWEHSPDTNEIRDAGVPEGCYCYRSADDLGEFDWSVDR
jgi:hypothetical protein